MRLSATNPTSDDPQVERGHAPLKPGVAGSALLSGSAHLLFWIVAAVIVVVDLWSKHWAFQTLPPDAPREYISGFLELRRSLNDGAVFGSFTGYVSVFIVASFLALSFVLYMFIQSGSRQRMLHVALALILAGAIGNLYDRAFIKADVVSFPNDASHRSIIGMVLNGDDDTQVLVGEWPDGARVRSYARSDVSIRRQGVVRDFLKFTPTFPQGWGRLGGQDVWPWIFNIADAALVCGVTLLMLTSIFERRSAPSAVAAAPAGT